MSRCWHRHVCLGSSNHLFDHAGEPRAWCSRFRKPPPWPSFVVCAPQISLKGPQFLWTQPEFLDCPRFDRYGFRQKKIYRTPEAKEKKAQHCQLAPKASNAECVVVFMAVSSCPCRASCFSHSRPSRSTRMVDAIRLFEFRRRRNSCSMYARVLRCTGYTWRVALTKGKPQESGNPHQTSQSAGELFLVNARPFPEQSSSIATCRVGSI